MSALGVPGAREDRDRQLVLQQQLLDAVVHVGRSLDQHVHRLQPLDRLLDQPGAGRAVVPDADQSQGHSTQPGSR